MKKRKILILFLILIISITTIFFLRKISKVEKYDDFLFLKLFSKVTLNSEENQINNNYNYKKEYRFKINYKNTNFKSINLAETINKESLIYEKIAPGTSGEFNILLDSNQNLKYKIQFLSMNEKPKNLNFKALKDGQIISEGSTLEELQKDLIGNIKKNEKINITINWYWNYEDEENGEYTDTQDTKDSENIKRYEFNIYTIGEEFS